LKAEIGMERRKETTIRVEEKNTGGGKKRRGRGMGPVLEETQGG